MSFESITGSFLPNPYSPSITNAGKHICDVTTPTTPHYIIITKHDHCVSAQKVPARTYEPSLFSTNPRTTPRMHHHTITKRRAWTMPDIQGYPAFHAARDPSAILHAPLVVSSLPDPKFDMDFSKPQENILAGGERKHRYFLRASTPLACTRYGKWASITDRSE